MNKYLESTWFMNSDAPGIIAFTEKHISGKTTELEKAVSLYYAVRDTIIYNPYRFSFNRDEYRATYPLELGEGFCVQKALLLTAVIRAAGIPARPGFANVINHLSTGRLRELLQSDLFVFHGYTEIYLEGKWVKATPAFNLSLCEKFGVHPLEFDGKGDSIFHPFNLAGQKHMEYVHDYGTFEDFPFELMIEECKKHYPHFASVIGNPDVKLDGNFEKEAEEENPGK